MANIATTYTFVNGTTADANQINQNFTDIINGTSDGTKDLSVSALTVAGTLTANGHVNLGNASADDLTITASLASTIAVKTTNSFDIGGTLSGLRALYFGANSQTVNIKGSASMSATWTLTLPVTAGSDREILQTNGSGVSSWVPVRREGETASNLGLAASVAANAITFALKGADGNDASSTNPVDIVFRNATLTTGTPVTRTVTAALTMSISSGSTLGHADNKSEFIWIYAIDNAGTVELAVSTSRIWDAGTVITTTAESAGASDSRIAIYSTTSRSNVAVRLIGRMRSTQTTAGTWAAAPTEIAVFSGITDNAILGEVYVSGGNGHGAVNTRVRRFVTTQSTKGSDITYADSANDGGSFTINTEGNYVAYYRDEAAGGAVELGVLVVAAGASYTNNVPSSQSYATGIRYFINTSAGSAAQSTGGALHLYPGDKVLFLTSGADRTFDIHVQAQLTRVS